MWVWLCVLVFVCLCVWQIYRERERGGVCVCACVCVCVCVCVFVCVCVLTLSSFFTFTAVCVHICQKCMLISNGDVYAAKAAEAFSQLKTMKATLESSRQEMAEYKEKASRILQVIQLSFVLFWFWFGWLVFRYFVLIYMSNIRIYVISCVHQSGGWLSYVAKTLTLDMTHKLITNFFHTHAMLTDTVDFYHFMHLSVTLTSAGGHKVGGKQNLLASFSWTLFNYSEWNMIWHWRNSFWVSWHYLWMRCIEAT